MPRRTPRQHCVAVLIAVLAVVAGTQVLLAPSAGAAGFVPISGSGSTWSSNALDQWRRIINANNGITVNFAANGSTSGRNDFRFGTVDFAVSEIPYGLTDAGVTEPKPDRAFGYMPIVAGGTAFMYNLKIGNKRVTNLRLSGDVITKIFTKKITNWADPAIQADNPGVALPARPIVPVVRSDGAGPTAQFTAWMANQYGGLWDDFCHQAGRNITPCGFTSFYPANGLTSKPGSTGVAGFVLQDASEGAITYVEYSYARNAGFPVVKMLNKANYYVEPKATSVAVALLTAQTHPDLTADLSQVYANPDPRAYPLSSYSYMIIPKDTSPGSHFSTEKGRTLSEFAYYFLCEGQQQADALGYSPLPINLVAAGVDQVGQIPGSTHKLNSNNLSSCHNPTVSPDGTNLLATNAPPPDPCDLKGATQCGVTGPPIPPPVPVPVPPTPTPPVPVPLPPPVPAPGPPDSAVTLSGKDDFSNLKVTVGQTKNLINQVVPITWTGSAPTQPGGGSFGTNYLQLMQCWGDDPAGPDRNQCQFGGAPNTAGGTWVTTRQLNGVIDPKETLKLPPDSPAGANAYVPFWPVGRPKPIGAVTTGSSEFFDRQTTNEVPLAQTYADGTGQQFFEVQTSRQAAGLGCGDPVTTGAATTGRKCWLVVVPRGTKEVDGTTPLTLESSPLSQSNWDNRIVFPLEFVPLSQACPLSQERRVVGNELAVEAVSRWQPALCAGGGAVYNYSQVPDDVARNLVEVGQSPGLALMTNPVPADQAPPDRPLVYAPVALSGLAIAFNIERQTDVRASPHDQLLNGQRFESMKLTPRLVAKLLTQSYQQAVATGLDHNQVPDYLKNNPAGLTVDPEFLDLNPDYKGFAVHIRPPDAMVQLGGSDITSLLWSWVKADPDASAFLAGTPDPHGMVVNPNNKGLTLPTSTFPRNDQSCVDVSFRAIPPVIGKNCTSDVHPFFNDMHTAARSASRGDTGGQSPTTDGTGVAVLKKDDRQPPGSRALIAVVDAATAARYNLPTASLLNTAHQYVAPTTASLLAGAAAMKPSPVPGVLATDPGATDPAAYPLAALSYAVTSPSTLDAAAGKDYAAFLRYAATPGQQPGVGPGQLPFGMAPLPDLLRAQAIAAAAAIEAQAGKTATATSTALEVTPASPVAAGTTETLTATVTPSAAGSVQFQDGTANIGSGVALSDGTATVPTTLPSGTHSLTAVFTPTDPTAVNGSTSPTVPYVVNTATGTTATTTTLTVSPNPTVPVILRATVAPPTAVGTVQFMDGTTALDAPAAVIGGHAALLTPTLTPGTHSLTAVFTPTDPATFGPSSSPPVSATPGQSQMIILLFLQHLLQSVLSGLQW